MQVIGIVPDSNYDDITESPLPFMYFALAQRYAPGITVTVRSNGAHVADWPGCLEIVGVPANTRRFELQEEAAMSHVVRPFATTRG